MTTYIDDTVVEEIPREPETWDEAAETCVSLICLPSTRSRLRLIEGSGVNVNDIRKQLDSMIKTSNNNSKCLISDDEWLLSWETLGSVAYEAARSGEIIKKNNENNINEFTSVLVKKQNDYGSDNIIRFGRIGLLVRLHDKVARLENLIKKKADPINESLYDNYMDVINYCAIGMMVEQEWFTLELSKK
jgi:hypothetical protein